MAKLQKFEGGNCSWSQHALRLHCFFTWYLFLFPSMPNPSAPYNSSLSVYLFFNLTAIETSVRMSPATTWFQKPLVIWFDPSVAHEMLLTSFISRNHLLPLVPAHSLGPFWSSLPSATLLTPCGFFGLFQQQLEPVCFPALCSQPVLLSWSV